MCGLAGLFTSTPERPEVLEARTLRMTDAIVHRGPDDDGVWVVPEVGLALGFRRLAIIDLSPTGHQPMASASGRFTVVFNGEIYNHKELRRVLEGEGARFRGHSDTEVMLAAFERWGVRGALPQLVGMFAIAVWDASERSLTLIRDRMGEKPLFYHRAPGTGLLFGSELKALCADPAFPRRLDLDSLALYFRYLYVPAPKCIYRDTWKLPPGHLLTIRDPQAPLLEPEPYWRLIDQPKPSDLARTGLDERELTDELEALLRTAVRGQMEADVPLGALLSGGIDSSTIVALMQAQSSRPVRTYTIGFDVAEHDESSHAAAVAAQLGTEHTALHVTGKEAFDLIPSLPDMFDEPLADPSAIPTYLVSKLARQEVTVALTGDGGDEVFAGYNRYRYGARMIRAAGAIPAPLRSMAAAGIRSLGSSRWDAAQAALPARWRTRLAGEKVQKLGAMFREPTPALQYRSLLSAWHQPEQLFSVPVHDDAFAFEATFGAVPGLRLEERMMLMDQGHYLPDDLLAKVDRASMAVSLETRAPILDHRVVEFGWRLPLQYKLKDGKSKWLLRQALYRHVPKALVERPKTGFTVPIAAWLRGPLAEWSRATGDGGVLSANLPPLRPIFESITDAKPASSAIEALRNWTLLFYSAWQARWNPSI